MDRMQTKVRISLGQSVYSNKIVQKVTTLDKLFVNLSNPIITNKKDGKYFVFASFKENIRNAQNIEKHYGATIDLDDTPLTVSDIQKIFKKYIYCIYTTHSHKKVGKGDRYRLVLPYKSPVDFTTHSETMLYLMHLLGGKGKVDVSSKALSRPMYLPASEQRRLKFFEFIEKRDGLLFAPTNQKIRDEIAGLQFEQNEFTELKSPLKIGDDVDEGGRNDTLARAIGKWIKDGVAKDDLHSFAESYNIAKFNPPLTSKEVDQVVKSIIKAHSRNTKDLDWGYEEIISRIKKAEKVEDIYEHIIDMTLSAKRKGKLKKSQEDLIVLALNQKSKIAKRTIRGDLEAKTYENIANSEDEVEASHENQIQALKKDLKDWVFVASDDRFYNKVTGELFKREAFSSMFATPNIEGSFIGLIMKYGLIKKVSRHEFDPSNDAIFVRNKIRYINTYIPPDIFPLPGDVSFILDHFKYLLPDDRERGIVLDFIAHLVQKPGEKIRWMPIIKGHKGIGKTIIAEKIIMPLIGFSNFSKVSNTLIKSDFNSWQLDCQLIVFEELDIGATFKEKKQLTDSLKSFITDDLMKAHRKGVDPYDTINKANCFGFTNEDDCVVVTPDERRFCMLRSDSIPRDFDYYMKLRKEAESKIAELYYYFLERDISKFNHLTAPDTAFTQEVKQFSMDWPASIIYEMVRDTKNPFAEAGMFSTDQIINYIRAVSTGKYRFFADDLLSQGSGASKKLFYALRNMGFIKYLTKERNDGRVFVNGKLSTIWLFPHFKDKMNQINDRKVKKALKTIKIKDDNWDE